jgi:2-polyprenyl-6-hydroxyphenyl methylase/3-demethylubiquinone-9 3-methyltransferase
LDVSRGSVDKAKEHSPLQESRLSYQVGSVYELPFPDNSFDAIVCSDVLEHLLTLHQAAKEIARVLKPGGIFTYDTINRTLFSWYAAILIFQKLITFVPSDTHDWRLFMKPSEVRSLFHQVGLRHSKEMNGMRPTMRWPVDIIRRLYRGRGWRSFMGEWKLTSSTMASFLSFAVKESL